MGVAGVAGEGAVAAAAVATAAATAAVASEATSASKSRSNDFYRRKQWSCAICIHTSCKNEEKGMQQGTSLTSSSLMDFSMSGTGTCAAAAVAFSSFFSSAVATTTASAALADEASVPNLKNPKITLF